MRISNTSTTSGLPQTQTGAVQSLTRFLSTTTPTTPADRRRLLTTAGLVGFTGIAGSLLWGTTRPKRLADVEAPKFRPATETEEARKTFESGMGLVAHPLSEMAGLHERLFSRKVRVEWELWVSKTCTRTECDTVSDPDGGSHQECHPETYDCSEYEDRDLVDHVWADELVRWREGAGDFHLNQNYLSHFSTEFQRIYTTLGELGQIDMLGLQRPEDPQGTANLDIEEFAKIHDYKWKTGEVGLGWQSAIASAIALPATAVIFLYGRITAALRSQLRGGHYSYYGYDRRETYRQTVTNEVDLTRRAFMQSLIGMSACAFIAANPDLYEKRSDVISAEGRTGIRGVIMDIMGASDKKLYTHFFKHFPDEIIKQARAAANRLRQVNVEMVNRSLQKGLLELQQKERELLRQAAASGRTRDIRTTRIDDHVAPHMVEQYVRKAHESADKIEEGAQVLATFFANGIPPELAPAMRARRATDEIKAQVSAQSGRHLWGLAGDLGIAYGAGIGAMLLTSIPLGEQSYVYNTIQAACDSYDRLRVSTENMVKAMRDQLNPRDVQNNIHKDPDIRQLVAQHIVRVRSMAQAEVEAQIVHAPAETTRIADMDAAAKQDLLRQLDGLDDNRVVDLYVEKALLYYVRRRQGIKGFMRALARDQRDEGDIYDVPSTGELHKEVLRFLQSAQNHFLYDLIEGDLVNDNEPDEDWITSETAKINRNIDYWADRVAGLFAASQPMYAALDILPHSWQTLSQKHETLTREDVKNAFAKAVQKELDSVRKQDKAKEDMQGIMNKRFELDKDRPERLVTTEEVAKRLLLKKLQGALTSHTELDVLFVHEPRLAAAMGG